MVGEIVVVKVKDVFFDGGLYCTLMEYNGIEGYVNISELTRRKIRSTRQSAMKKGQLDLAKVDKVDVLKGFIDLNKEQLPREVVEQVTIRWNNSKKINSIMKSVAHQVETRVEEVYQKFLWPLARDMKKLGKDTITGLSYFLKDPEGMTKKYNLQQNFVDALIPQIKKMVTPKQHRITALIQANCDSWQGVTRIKRALKAGALVSTPNCPVQIVLLKPPSTWQIKIHTLKPQEGCTVIWQILEKIRRVLTLANRGQFRLVKAPVMRDPDKNETAVICQDPKIQIGSVEGISFADGNSTSERRRRIIKFADLVETPGPSVKSTPDSVSKMVKRKRDERVGNDEKAKFPGNSGDRLMQKPVTPKLSDSEYSTYYKIAVSESPACSPIANSQLSESKATKEDHISKKDKFEMDQLEGALNRSPGFPAFLEKPFLLHNGKEGINKPAASLPSGLLPLPIIRHSSNDISQPKVSASLSLQPLGRNRSDPTPYTKRSTIHKPLIENLPSSIDQELPNSVSERKSFTASPNYDQSKKTESTLLKISNNKHGGNMRESAPKICKSPLVGESQA